MTPQEFVETLDRPEQLRHVAIVAALPLYCVSQWMAAVQKHAGVKYDRYSFRINPMRLHAFIDGVDEPRLAITFYDAMERNTEALYGNAMIIREISL
jgi:hypothetical protein